MDAVTAPTFGCIHEHVTDTLLHASTIGKSSTRCRLLVTLPFLGVCNWYLAVVTDIVSMQKEYVINRTERLLKSFNILLKKLFSLGKIKIMLIFTVFLSKLHIEIDN